MFDVCCDVMQEVRHLNAFASRLIRILGNETIGNESIAIAFDVLLRPYQ